MSLSPRRLNRATLARQMLLERGAVDVVEGVRRIGALQAQEPASPYLALWNRVAGFDPGDLDAAFSERRLVKASLLRLTLHAVHHEDYQAFHRAMLPSLRSSRLTDGRFTSTGLSTADADALLPEVVKFLAGPRTVAEIEALLAERIGRREPRLWWALKMFAPLHHAPIGGPWSFGSPPSFVAAPVAVDGESHGESVQRLFLRYLEGFGPASVRDFEQFTILRRPVVLEAVGGLGGRLEELEGPDGGRLFDVPGAELPSEDTPAPPRLLPMWDSILLAYWDRSRVLPAEYRPIVIRRNGDVLPTLLVDGYVAGVWRPVDGGIEAKAFHRLDDETWEGLAVEAVALGALLALRQRAIYRRYARWWSVLPGEEVRLLPG